MDDFLTQQHSDELADVLADYFEDEADYFASFEDEATAAGDGPEDHFHTDGEADADALASAGYGTDEDYGYYGEDSYY